MQRINKKVVLYCAVNLFFLTLFFLYGGIINETKDDYLIQSFFLPNCGPLSNWHMWTSIAWSTCINVVQSIMPQYAGHYLLLLMLTIVSLNAIIVWMDKRLKINSILKIGLIFCITIAVYTQTINTFNYSRTAGLLMAVGILLCFEESKLAYITGFTLFLFGSIIRFKVIYMLFGFGVIIILIWILETQRFSWSCLLQVFGKPFFVIIVAIVLEMLSFLIIESREEDKSIYEYNRAMSSVQDYAIQEYDESAEQYSLLNMSKNDYLMLENRMSNADPEFFSAELYNNINTSLKRRDSIKTCFTNMVKDVGLSFALDNFFRFTIGIIFLQVLFIDKKRYYIPVLIGFMIITYVVFFEFILGRFRQRAFVGVSFFAMASIFFSFKLEHYSGIKKRIRAWKSFILVVVVILATVSAPYYIRNKQDWSNEKELFSILEKDYDHFYNLTCGCSLQYRTVDNPLRSNSYGDSWNMYYMTQLALSDHEKEKFERFDFANCFRDSVDSEVIRFVDDNSHIDIIEQYIKEHYCSSANAVLDKTIGNYYVYRIVS